MGIITDETLCYFTQHFGIDLRQEPNQLLAQVSRAFARLPYENLSKIIREAERGRVTEARPDPAEVLRDHIRLGTGGTCFSLTATLLHLVRQLGWQAQPILADRPYGPNTHCALLLWRDGQPHLLDPGFLLFDPLPLPKSDCLELRSPFHQVYLMPRPADDKLDLYIVSPRGERQLRITYKTSPVDWGEFLRVWDESFDWDMMRYPLVTQVREGEHIYLKGTRLQRRKHQSVLREELPPCDLARQIHQIFGIALPVVHQALNILERRGEKYGQAPAS
ncbi:MAG: arylamine N-acetyltransferase [Gemmatales bacterium]|nr:arylamine N-acetyltransferase [Gemmatales bacterium]MCS7158844.1 arylamine N-acetyltransferase [Gemmatales bacterium]MDW8174043.1 arylamine N-acetyltransferase [Gemmatales bacterium]MDW8221386.1 arylamine N-acetyltransferase [Gemmatales bacterium]